MVFHTDCSARSVIPISSRQDGATSGWMYIRRRRWLHFAASPNSTCLPSSLVMSRCGMSAPAGTEFM